MKFVVDGTKYEMDDSKITFAEARAVEKATGRSMAEIEKTGEDITTIQAMIWVAMKRQEPTLRFSDLDDLPMGDIEWLPEDEQPDDGEQPDPTVAAEAAEDGDSTPSG